MRIARCLCALSLLVALLVALFVLCGFCVCVLRFVLCFAMYIWSSGMLTEFVRAVIK